MCTMCSSCQSCLTCQHVPQACPGNQSSRQLSSGRCDTPGGAFRDLKVPHTPNSLVRLSEAYRRNARTSRQKTNRTCSTQGSDIDLYYIWAFQQSDELSAFDLMSISPIFLGLSQIAADFYHSCNRRLWVPPVSRDRQDGNEMISMIMLTHLETLSERKLLASDPLVCHQSW